MGEVIVEATGPPRDSMPCRMVGTPGKHDESRLSATWKSRAQLAGAGFLGQLGVAPFRAGRLVMRVMAAQVISVSECWMSRS
jgi:hypothetical protein